jgi:aminoglycoside/choline kinase family phosphotransferase
VSSPSVGCIAPFYTSQKLYARAQPRYLWAMHADGVDLLPALHRLFGSSLPELSITKLKGDASTRSYYRLDRKDGGAPHRSLIAMRLPEDAQKPDEVSSAAASAGPPELPFIDVQRMLAARGLPVPRVLVDDTPGRVLLLDDLGDETFEARLRSSPQSEWPARYAEAATLLARMHEACEPPQPAESIAFRRTFDRTLLRWELDHFREWGIEAIHGPLEPADRAALDACFDRITDRILELPRGFVHRDYQSRNLMWAPRDGAAPQLTVIDFQDALIGPQAYDLVALLNDSYVALDAELQRATVLAYAKARGFGDAQTDALLTGFSLVAVQRKLKDAGRFVFIDRIRGNPGFLPHYPQSLRYAGRALAATGDRELQALLERLVPGFPDATKVPDADTASAGS